MQTIIICLISLVTSVVTTLLIRAWENRKKWDCQRGSYSVNLEALRNTWQDVEELREEQE